ncbi:Ni/Fe hydrogenase subunit alpha, partial [Candidatus Bathyarchaeota archaeon]|nr:Ni/Fe hydrogenase subunit alpha [Candidatus Bathyarchaeota archaeon]
MKYTIPELTRVEGHGGIEVTLKANQVETVKFNVFEGPRFFESMIKGHYYDKIPDITRRICAICTASHSLASIGAIENAFNVEVTPQTELLRDLLIHGETIESHALHVFMLALPDYLGYPDAISMASEYPDAVKNALELKKTGNMIHTLLSGREVHGMNERVGGFSTIPGEEELEKLRKSLIRVKPVTELAVNLLKGFDPPTYNNSDNLLMALDPGEKFGFLGDYVVTSQGERFHQDEYQKITNETVVKHSYAKHSLFEGKPFMVGSLPRVKINGDKLEGVSRELYQETEELLPANNTISNNLAQAIELVHCIDRSVQDIDVLLSDGLENEGIVDIEIKKNRGINAVEAPRGILYHDYTLNEAGEISKANIITPTAQNAANIEK